MDTVALSGLAATSSSSQTLQSSSAANRTASSGGTSTTTSTPTPTIFYSSPVVDFDAATGALIWKYRDPTTGDFLYQSPSRTALLYERSQRLAESQGKPAETGQTGGQGRIGQNVTIFG